jgi:hypothetical protein
MRKLASLSFVALVAAACGGAGSSDSPPSSNDAAGAGGGSGSAGSTAGSGPGGSASGGVSGSASGGKGGVSGGGAGGEVAGTSGAAGTGTAGGGAAGQSGGAGTSNAGTAGAAGNGGAAAGAAGAGGEAGGGGDPGPVVVTFCQSDAECATNELTKLCDPTTARCVECLPSQDACPAGQFCRVQTKVCTAGCKGDADCPSTAAHCDPLFNVCKQCLSDAQCAPGELCSNGACAAGCSATKPCADASQTCCGDACHDLSADVQHCGACETQCPTADNATAVCNASKCETGPCAAGFADCNLDPSDGCEVNTAVTGQCLCVPGDTASCYTGPAGTENVGLCKGGTKVCGPSGMDFLPGCFDQVLPKAEVCGDGKDHDCNGVANDVADIDGDGWTACQGDCCEDTTQCGTPTLVNPGAYDVPGDNIQDDCGAGAKYNTVTCGSSAKLSGVSGQDLACAFDVEQFTADKPPAEEKIWGVISAQILLADGKAPTAKQLVEITDHQAAVRTQYGVNAPKHGPTMVGISSGAMRDEDDSDFAKPDPGTTYSSATTPPKVYTDAHGGKLVSSSGCNGKCAAGAGANDSVLLRLRIRVPTNAQSFSYDFRYFSAEYAVWQCSAFNDFFLALLTTSAAGIPADHNISFDSLNNPVSVNNGFFEVCQPRGCNVCPAGTGDLSGTGMELQPVTCGAPGPKCPSSGTATGGGTKWLTTKAPVVPGEVITLDLMVFDVSDHRLDSLAILDNFRWSATPSGPPTTTPAQLAIRDFCHGARFLPFHHDSLHPLRGLRGARHGVRGQRDVGSRRERRTGRRGGRLRGRRGSLGLDLHPRRGRPERRQLRQGGIERRRGRRQGRRQRGR